MVVAHDALSAVALPVERMKGIQKRFLIMIYHRKVYAKAFIEKMAKQGLTIVTHFDPLPVARSHLKQNGGTQGFYLLRSKSSFLRFCELSNEQNAFKYIFKHGTVNEKPSNKLCRKLVILAFAKLDVTTYLLEFHHSIHHS